MKTKLVLIVLLTAIGMLAAIPAANAQAVTWKLNVDKSRYKPGPMPVKNLTITVEELSDGVRATATGEQIDGLRISATYFGSWDGKVHNFSPANSSIAPTPYYNAIIVPFGSRGCYTMGTEEYCVSIFGHHDPFTSVGGGSVETSIDNRLSDCLPSKTHLAFKGEKMLVGTTKGTNANGKFEQTFVYERQ